MGIFDNAESVVINGHEVQSIIDSNGGVLYEKQSGDNYLLTLTSDKDILSYYDHDTCIITASLTNWGEPLEGESVVFSCDNPIETIEVSSSGIYDFGEYFIINCAELPINPGFDSTQRIIIGDTDNFLEISKNEKLDKLGIMKNNRGWYGFNDDIVIKNGVLKAYQEEYQTYQTLDVSDVDLTKWTLITTNSVVIPVEKYFYETAVTDSNGEASVSYESKGTGDLNIKACVPERMLVSEIYSIEDCVSYDSAEHTESFTSVRFTTILTNNNISNVSISLDLKTSTYDYSCVYGISYNSESDQIGFGTTNTTGRIYRTLNGTNNHSNYSGFNQNNVYYNLRFERTGTTLKLYLNDILIDTSTNNEISSFKYLNFGSWRNKTIYYKNVKVKPL